MKRKTVVANVNLEEYMEILRDITQGTKRLAKGGMSEEDHNILLDRVLFDIDFLGDLVKDVRENNGG